MSAIITGDCSLCGETVTIVDGVWPPGHGFGKCAGPAPNGPGFVRETISIPITDLFDTGSPAGGGKTE